MISAVLALSRIEVPAPIFGFVIGYFIGILVTLLRTL